MSLAVFLGKGIKTSELESSLHLSQTPLYRGGEGTWKKSFIDAVSDCNGKLTWDPAAILSILSFGYVCGDRTLLNEVKRRPWLSRITEDGECFLETIPPHGRLWKPYDEITDNFVRAICNEAIKACRGRKEIYLLLSGGLDSRVAGAALAKLVNEGRLATKPIAVTWGPSNCRDVVYGREVARLLEFKWIHVDFGPEDVMYNIDEAVGVGSLVSPVHLHRMSWFRQVSRDAVVIASSYGDMVGRAEFSGRHLLELDYLHPVNAFGLVKYDIFGAAYQGVMKDLKQLRERAPNQPKYVLCEHQMHGNYTRGMLMQAMSLINQHCTLYQMFTDPNVYSYMWSIHPALRFDDTYANVLKKLAPRVAKIPWARTNRALQGRTSGAKSNLQEKFHSYESWIGAPLFDRLYHYVDPEWFGQTGIFEPEKIRNLAEEVRNGRDGKGPYGFWPYEEWLWLASLRRMAEHLDRLGKSVALDSVAVDKPHNMPILVPWTKRYLTGRILGRSALAYNLARRCSKPLRGILKKVRRSILKYQAVCKYPPEGRTKQNHHEHL